FLYLLFTFPDVSNSEGNRHHFASRFVFLVSLLAYPSQGGAGFGERCLSTSARWSSLPVAEFAWWPHEQLGMRRPRGDLTPRVLLRSPSRPVRIQAVTRLVTYARHCERRTCPVLATSTPQPLVPAAPPLPSLQPCHTGAVRRRRLTPVVILLGVFFAMTPGSSVASDDEQQWHQYRHNETNNAVLTSPVDEIYAGFVTTENEVRATPTIVGRTMFVGNHDSGDLQAYDLQSGEQRWHNQAPNWVHSELIYVDGVIIVGFGNRFFEGDIRGTGESGFLGLDAEAGEYLCRFETEGQVMPPPAKANGTVHIVTGDHHHYELDPDTGEEVSRTDIGHVVSMSSPGSNGDLLFFGGGHPAPFAFTALDPHSSEIAWQVEFPDVISGVDDVPPAISGDTVVTSANIAGPQSPSGDEDEILDTHMLYA